MFRFVRSLLEEPEVWVIGAGQGPAGSIIHRMFVSAQRVRAKLKRFRSLNKGLKGTKKCKLQQMHVHFPKKKGVKLLFIITSNE